MYFLVLPVLVCDSIETSRCDLPRKRKISFFFPLIVCILKPRVYSSWVLFTCSYDLVYICNIESFVCTHQSGLGFIP